MAAAQLSASYPLASFQAFVLRASTSLFLSLSLSLLFFLFFSVLFSFFFLCSLDCVLINGARPYKVKRNRVALTTTSDALNGKAENGDTSTLSCSGRTNNRWQVCSYISLFVRFIPSLSLYLSYFLSSLLFKETMARFMGLFDRGDFPVRCPEPFLRDPRSCS